MHPAEVIRADRLRFADSKDALYQRQAPAPCSHSRFPWGPKNLPSEGWRRRFCPTFQAARRYLRERERQLVTEIERASARLDLVERAMPDKSILPTIVGFGIMVVFIVTGLICMGG